uniref:Uncharacterized protein n=1 Tax=Micrurus surinamensis TaxID=129470 RepID=A0A2D4Q2W0_MICSU
MAPLRGGGFCLHRFKSHNLVTVANHWNFLQDMLSKHGISKTLTKTLLGILLIGGIWFSTLGTFTVQRQACGSDGECVRREAGFLIFLPLLTNMANPLRIPESPCPKCLCFQPGGSVSGEASEKPSGMIPPPVAWKSGSVHCL